ncbi:hypothetical protein, partial [Streptococcus salivarius]|uniref:hypothetical protein n=1 Tax=Streptococcus salivarius TaxID=1304 RepID=UPI0034A10C7B
MNDEQKKDFEEIQKSLKEFEDIISKPNFSDIKDINNIVAKASDIYKKSYDIEDIAYSNVSILATLAMKQEGLADVKATVAKASSIYKKFPD